MLKNYIKIAFRNIRRNKIFASINITGLVIGIACCLLIGLFITHELSYDRHFENAHNIYRIAWWPGNPQTRTPHPMARAMARDFPEVESGVSISPIWGPGLTRPAFSVRYEDKRFDEKGFFSADSTFFEVFSFKLIRGDKDEALTRPGGIVITKRIAKKYFGNADPMGKTLRVNDQFDLEVTGVMENIPANTHFHFDFLISYVTLKPLETGEYYTWADFGHYNYVLLQDNIDAARLEAKLPEWSAQYIDWPEESINGFKEGRTGFRLQPLTDIHLYSNIRWELEANGNIAYIYIFSGAALFILIIACVNFMNLTTARSLTRAKEVGLRKSVGAHRSQLIVQFLAESVLLCGLSVILALMVVDILAPWFNDFAGIKTVLALSNWKLLTGLLIGAGILGILAGSYPAFVLSKFKPARVLKGKFTSSNEGLWLRKGLVVLQFTVSVILIAGTLVIYKQLNYLGEKDLGFDQEQVAVIPIKNDQVRSRYEALKDRLSGISGVQQITAVSNVPGGSFNQQHIQWREDDPRIDVSELRTDYDFVEALDIKLVAGRSFSKRYAEDNGHTFLLNESAVRQFGWDDPVNKEITYFDDDVTRKGKVIGVVEDFHFQPLHQTIAPLVIQMLPEEFNYMLVKLQPENISGQLASIERIWKEFDPVFNFEYSFLDSEFEANYRQEEKAGSILFLFSGLAILIACMGLFGLTSFAVQNRLKEIGVRKILGAGITGIVGLFSKQFVQLILISFLISIPVAIWIMSNWLRNFAYKTEIGVAVFLVPGLIVMAIALITITSIAVKAALKNPVESLRSE